MGRSDPKGLLCGDVWANQIPGNVFFFTLLDAGILTASKIAEIIKWNRRYASVAEGTGWVRYEKVEPIVVPGQRAEFTAKQVRELYVKMQRNAAGENIPLTAEEQAAINATSAVHLSTLV